LDASSGWSRGLAGRSGFGVRALGSRVEGSGRGIPVPLSKEPWLVATPSENEH
jgi:hypothetical protein